MFRTTLQDFGLEIEQTIITECELSKITLAALTLSALSLGDCSITRDLGR